MGPPRAHVRDSQKGGQRSPYSPLIPVEDPDRMGMSIGVHIAHISLFSLPARRRFPKRPLSPFLPDPPPLPLLPAHIKSHELRICWPWAPERKRPSPLLYPYNLFTSRLNPFIPYICGSSSNPQPILSLFGAEIPVSPLVCGRHGPQLYQNLCQGYSAPMTWAHLTTWLPPPSPSSIWGPATPAQ